MTISGSEFRARRPVERQSKIGRRDEAIATGLRQFGGPGIKGIDAERTDELIHAAGVERKAERQDRTDIAVPYVRQHAFVQAVRGLDNHPEHQAIAYVVDRKLHLSSEQVGKAWLECFRSVGEIVVEAGARATAGTSPRRHQLSKFATHFVCSDRKSTRLKSSH